VKACVLRVAEHLEVVRMIVASVFVDVVNMLVRTQQTADLPLRNETMLVDIAS